MTTLWNPPQEMPERDALEMAAPLAERVRRTVAAFWAPIPLIEDQAVDPVGNAGD